MPNKAEQDKVHDTGTIRLAKDKAKESSTNGRNMFTVSVDTGGTFTDVILETSSGHIIHKTPSTPDDPSRAVLLAIQEVFTKAKLPANSVCHLIHGSTVATNTLLEADGCDAVFIATEGFQDILHIARQNRKALYALVASRDPAPIDRARCLGVTERLDCSGQVITPLDLECLDKIDPLLSTSQAVAITLLHSYANPAHETALGKMIAARHPHLHITLGSELSDEFREYERAATCAANAVVAPRMEQYVKHLECSPAVASLRIMSSAGGSLTGQQVRASPVHTVLSGPAGGVLGALGVGLAVGSKKVLTFDMGGTSTDVSLCNATPSMTSAVEIAGLPLRIPAISIHTVGAGGGSIAWVDDGGALRVGPQSAGAQPGPACYGKTGRQPTVTDANVVLGRLEPKAFLGGRMPLYPDLAQDAVKRIADTLGMTTRQAAHGIIRIAETTMARALKVISIERGHDPREFALVTFGGAGGLHACNLADQMGVSKVIVPPDPGLLSAIGMLGAPSVNTVTETVLRVAETDADLRPPDQLVDRAIEPLTTQGFSRSQCTITTNAFVRYQGQSHELEVSCNAGLEGFHLAHQHQYGYRTQLPVELVAIRVRVQSPGTPWALGSHALGTQTTMQGTVSRHDLAAGASGVGPLLITEYSSTTWVPEDWTASVHKSGALILEPCSQ